MTIQISTRHACHPDDVKQYDTQKLREHFLLESVFDKDTISGVYSTFDRLIVGGIFPSSAPLELLTVDQLKSDYFLERREIGIINVGDTSSVTVDGTTFSLKKKEALYIGRG